MQDWTAGDEVTATKLNEIYQGNGQVYTYGETIAINDTVYLKASDSKVYKTDSDYSDERIEFLGFAKEAGNANDTGSIQTSGKVSGLSSLTVGAYYYLSGTAGGISTATATYFKKIGRAVSTTEIFIDKDPAGMAFGPSETLRNSDNTEKGTSSTSYVKIKEVKINFNTNGGKIRIKFDGKKNDTGADGYGRIYRNGSAIGTEQQFLTASYVTVSEDFGPFVINDLIQVYGKKADGSFSVQNFRFYYDKIIVPETDFTNQDP